MPNRNVYFVIDCAESMRGQNANAVNETMQTIFEKCVPDLIANKEKDLNIFFHVFACSSVFPNGVEGIVAKTLIEDIVKWQLLNQNYFKGMPAKGAGLAKAIDEIQGGVRGEPDAYAITPVVVLISNGDKDQYDPSFDKAMECATKGSENEVKAFRKALRVSISINANSNEALSSLIGFGNISKRMEENGYKRHFTYKELLDNNCEYLKQLILWQQFCV